MQTSRLSKRRLRHCETELQEYRSAKRHKTTRKLFSIVGRSSRWGVAFIVQLRKQAQEGEEINFADKTEMRDQDFSPAGSDSLVPNRTLLSMIRALIHSEPCAPASLHLYRELILQADI